MSAVQIAQTVTQIWYTNLAENDAPNFEFIVTRTPAGTWGIALS